MRRRGRGSVWQRLSPGMPRSAQACRHSGPWAAGRRFFARAWATRWANSWRRVRSISSGNSRSFGLRRICAVAGRARPAVLLRRRCQQTATRSARVSQPTARAKAAAVVVRVGSLAGARGRGSGEGGAGAAAVLSKKENHGQNVFIAARSAKTRHDDRTSHARKRR